MSGKQLAFNLSLPFPYAPDAFVEHDGVKSIIERFRSQANSHLECIIGEERSGKTHFAVHLAHLLKSTVEPTAFVHAQDLESFFEAPSDASLYIIDDIDRYLDKYESTGSGPLVGFIEFCRARKRKICLMTARGLADFPVDAHLTSRFKAAVTLPMGQPLREEILQILPAFAAQRALKFDAGVFDFLQMRLPASISEIDAYFTRLTTLSYIRTATKINRQMLQDALG